MVIAVCSAVLLVSATAVSAARAALASKPTTSRVSASSSGIQAEGGPSLFPSLSSHGRFVAFSSRATNLTPDDSNSVADVFVHDLATGETTRVSVTSDGEQANGRSATPSMSANGRFVVFTSGATNLVPDDRNGKSDVFVHDLTTGVTARVSVASDGSQANGRSFYASISVDGRFVVFTSSASNLVSGDTNASNDVFIRDLAAGTTSRVSVASDGTEANAYSLSYPEGSVSEDGRFVALLSAASNLVPDDTNGDLDVFVHDLVIGETTRMSVASDGSQANDSSYRSTISASGRFVAFDSDASNLIPGDSNQDLDVFVHDRITGVTTRIDVASDGTEARGGFSVKPSISADGQFVAFDSGASNLVRGDSNAAFDVFVHDLATGKTIRVSVGSGGKQANGDSRGCSISASGRFIAFPSDASNLVSDDTNGIQDVFERGPLF